MAYVPGMRLKVKSNKVMGDYICLHGLVPDKELPKKLRKKIPKKEIWIRRDIYKNKPKRYRIMEHERTELHLMKSKKMSYKKAHSYSQVAEKGWPARQAIKRLKQ